MEKIDGEWVVRMSGKNEWVISRAPEPWRREIDAAIARARRVLCKHNPPLPLRWVAVVPEDVCQKFWTREECLEILHNRNCGWYEEHIRSVPQGAIAVRPTREAPTATTSVRECGSIIVCEYASECKGDSPISLEDTVCLFSDTIKRVESLNSFWRLSTPNKVLLQTGKEHCYFGIEDVCERCMAPRLGVEGTPFPDESYFFDPSWNVDKLTRDLRWGFNIRTP
jgi:hypothetical protein